MAKEAQAPSVGERLAVVEALIARDNAAPEPDARREDIIVQEGEESDLRQALARVEVRRVFYRVFKIGGLMEADSDPNLTIMAHHVGRRSLALDLYNAIKKVDAGAFFQMERENASDLKSRENKQEAPQ